jgi:hypothetical protein
VLNASLKELTSVLKHALRLFAINYILNLIYIYIYNIIKVLIKLILLIKKVEGLSIIIAYT